MLSHVLGHWTHAIANDKFFRYCPTCLSYGFQSSICQIDAIERCPVHGDALRNTCAVCGALTPRYAWDRTLQVDHGVLCCSKCGKAYALAWNRSHWFKWRPMPGAEIYVEMEKDLSRVITVRRINVRSWDWRLDTLTKSEQRKSEFFLLKRLLGLRTVSSCVSGQSPIRSVLRISLPLDKGTGREGKSDLESEELATLRQGYERARTQAEGMMEDGKQLLDEIKANPQLRDQGTPLQLLRSFSKPRTFAALLFRFRNELYPRLLDFDQPATIRWIPGYLHNLFLGRFYPGTAARWERFFWTCYRAELRFISFMEQHTRGLSEGDDSWSRGVGQRYLQAMEMPHGLTLPPGTGTFRVDHGETSYAVFVCAAMPVAFRKPKVREDF